MIKMTVCMQFPLTQVRLITLHLLRRIYTSAGKLFRLFILQAHWFSSASFRRDELMLKPCVVSGGRASRHCHACSFMRADKHRPDGLSDASGRSPESSALKQCWCWGERLRLAMGNTCAGVSSWAARSRGVGWAASRGREGKRDI